MSAGWGLSAAPRRPGRSAKKAKAKRRVGARKIHSHERTASLFARIFLSGPPGRGAPGDADGDAPPPAPGGASRATGSEAPPKSRAARGRDRSAEARMPLGRDGRAGALERSGEAEPGGGVRRWARRGSRKRGTQREAIPACERFGMMERSGVRTSAPAGARRPADRGRPADRFGRRDASAGGTSRPAGRLGRRDVSAGLARRARPSGPRASRGPAPVPVPGGEGLARRLRRGRRFSPISSPRSGRLGGREVPCGEVSPARPRPAPGPGRSAAARPSSRAGGRRHGRRRRGRHGPCGTRPPRPPP